ncbi:MAG: trypsin-like peptidase domain-containing protein [Chloroflexia bacterium]|nr:trypsin-like peptidase domain-containing protein [Chloroflexia bacterium]MDQ3410866.1 S1C family serine protease [Chloroflexota bacterium]
MLHTLVAGGLNRRSLRTLTLVVAQVATLGLGAAGAVLWQNQSADPAPMAQQTAQQDGTTDPACRPLAAGEMSVADIAERANPAVVTITNLVAASTGTPEQPEEDDEVFPLGTGSGFIIAASGLVVTNSHVVGGADELQVRFFDGTTVAATVLGQDDPNLLDVALVQLDLADGVAVPGVLALGDSDAIRPGERVVAIGSALGAFTNTVTEGMINAVGRSLGQYGIDSLIQHDAEIWRGNSGGPLLNLRGEVIGVNSAGLSENQMSATSPADIAFAISSNAVQGIIDEVLATGTVARPYVGIIGQDMATGHEIASVEPGTPAAAAGLQAGDIIVAVDGEALGGEVSLLELLFAHRPGDIVTLEIVRDGATEMIDVTLGTRPILSQ